MSITKKKFVKRPENAVPDEAFVIALSAMINTVVKGVSFYKGVGVLDYPGLALSRADWFESLNGFLIQKQGFGLDVLVDYFKNQHSAKITEIKAEDSEKLKNALAAGKLIDKKYYKVFLGKEKPSKKDAEEKPDEKGLDIDKKVSADDFADGSAAKDTKPPNSTPKEELPKGSKGS